jgi:MerR family mercuric resistance operon transcriptional regulator
MKEKITIGKLANLAGVNVETIRFYQRRGLLIEPVRPFKGIRQYSERDIQQVHFIKQGQKLGFTLDEISELLRLEQGQHCREAKAIAERKLVLIHQRLESLRIMETALAELVESCADNAESISCPILVTLLGAAPER